MAFTAETVILMSSLRDVFVETWSSKALISRAEASRGRGRGRAGDWVGTD